MRRISCRKHVLYRAATLHDEELEHIFGGVKPPIEPHANAPENGAPARRRSHCRSVLLSKFTELSRKVLAER